MKEYNKQFLHKLQKQDPAAFSTIYDELVDQFFRYIKSNYFLDNDTVQDIVWDIFVKIRQALPKLDVESSLSGFLWTIARNHVKDHFKRHDEVLFSELSWSNEDGESVAREDGLADASDIMKNMQTSHTFEQIQQAMDSMDASYKEAIYMKYIEEFSYEEISERLWLSQDAIRQRISRWLKRLTDMLSHLE